MNKQEMTARELKDLDPKELLTELNYINRMSKFYYNRKEEIMREIERRDNND